MACNATRTLPNGSLTTTLQTFLLTVWLFLHLLVVVGALSLPLCKDERQLRRGYTYTVDPGTGKKVWSFCQFPDPRYDQDRCGLPDWSEPSFLCDPDNLIGSSQTARDVNNNLRTIQNKTSRQCAGADGARQGYIVVVVLLDVIRVGSPFLIDSCQNNCGEIHPTLNASVAKEAEINVAMETMADGLRRELGMGACGNDLLLLYCKTFNKVRMSAGWRVLDAVDKDTLADLESQFLDYVNNHQLAAGLSYVTRALETDLRGLTPASVMLILTVIAAALLALFLLFYIYVSDTDYNAWGHEGVLSKMADVAVKGLTGVYVIDWVLKGAAHASFRIPVWSVPLLTVAAVACFVAAFATSNVYTKAI